MTLASRRCFSERTTIMSFANDSWSDFVIAILCRNWSAQAEMILCNDKWSLWPVHFGDFTKNGNCWASLAHLDDMPQSISPADLSRKIDDETLCVTLWKLLLIFVDSYQQPEHIEGTCNKFIRPQLPQAPNAYFCEFAAQTASEQINYLQSNIASRR